MALKNLKTFGNPYCLIIVIVIALIVITAGGGAGGRRDFILVNCGWHLDISERINKSI